MLKGKDLQELVDLQNKYTKLQKEMVETFDARDRIDAALERIRKEKTAVLRQAADKFGVSFVLKEEDTK